MKRNNLNAIVTGIVRHYTEKGWVPETDNSSHSSVDGMHSLFRGRGHVAVDVRRPEFKEVFKEVAEDGHFTNLWGLDSHILFKCRATKGPFDWVEPGNVISGRVFFKVGGNWYVGDVREAGIAMGKRRGRWVTHDRACSFLSFHPAEAFLDKYIRQRHSWRAVKPADVIIEKRDDTYWIRKNLGNHDFFTVSFPSERWSEYRRNTRKPVVPP